jgi:hypothetical protein
MKDWEIVADNLSKAGWSWGCVSAIDSNGRTIWVQTRSLLTAEPSAKRAISCVSGEALHEN